MFYTLFEHSETFSNVLNWLPRGIIPTRWFSDRFKTSSDVIFANYPRISLVSMFEERPNHSRLLKFPNDGGIWPIKVIVQKVKPLEWFKLSNRLWNLPLETIVWEINGCKEIFYFHHFNIKSFQDDHHRIVIITFTHIFQFTIICIHAHHALEMIEKLCWKNVRFWVCNVGKPWQKLSLIGLEWSKLKSNLLRDEKKMSYNLFRSIGTWSIESCISAKNQQT